MTSFWIPSSVYIVKNEGMTRTMHNEHQDEIPLILEHGHPDNFGYTTVATISVDRSSGFIAGGTPEDFLASLKQRAYEAYEAGETQITL